MIISQGREMLLWEEKQLVSSIFHHFTSAPPESSVSGTGGLHSANLVNVTESLPVSITDSSICLSICMMKSKGFAVRQTGA